MSLMVKNILVRKSTQERIKLWIATTLCVILMCPTCHTLAELFNSYRYEYRCVMKTVYFFPTVSLEGATSARDVCDADRKNLLKDRQCMDIPDDWHRHRPAKTGKI